MRLTKLATSFAISTVAVCFATFASADVVVTPSSDPGDYTGFVNVFDLGGGFTFGSGWGIDHPTTCLLYTSPSPRDRQKSRMPSSA